MLAFIVLIIIRSLVHAHPDPEDPWLVCQTCDGDDACIDAGSADETCQELPAGSGEYMCYWTDDFLDVGAPGFDRQCKSDYDCARFVAEEIQSYPEYLMYIVDHNFELPELVKINHCMRCCPNDSGEDLCMETYSTIDISTESDVYCGTFQFEHNNNAQTNSYGFNLAPCCAGDVCLDNNLGICGTQVGECEACISWNTQQVDFDDSVDRLSNCQDGLVCLTDDSPAIDMNDIDYVNYGFGEFEAETDRRRLQTTVGRDWSKNFDIKNLRPHVTVEKGICVAEDGVTIKEPATCDTNDDCSTCMRCCAGNDGIKQCLRNSGDICGLSFAGRGPCCCADECCSNECITPAPTESPTESGDSGEGGEGGDSDSSGDYDEVFNAQKLSGLTDNDNKSGNMGYMWTLSDKAMINLWGVVLVFIFVVFIPTIVLGYCCLYKKKGQASFKNDINEINDEMNDV